MRPGQVTFDEYWAAFVLEHWHSASRRRRVLALGKSFAKASLGVLSPKLSALLSVERPNLRWAAAALLLSVGKSLAKTMDREITRVATIDPPARAPAPTPISTSALAPARAPASASAPASAPATATASTSAPAPASASAPASAPPTGDWAVWM
jgi:cell division septation protein DedD